MYPERSGSAHPAIIIGAWVNAFLTGFPEGKTSANAFLVLLSFTTTYLQHCMLDQLGAIRAASRTLFSLSSGIGSFLFNLRKKTPSARVGMNCGILVVIFKPKY